MDVIESAEELIKAIGGGNKRTYGDFTHALPGICHGSTNPKSQSLMVGNRPDGSIAVYCWNCEHDTFANLQDRLGVFLGAPNEGKPTPPPRRTPNAPFRWKPVCNVDSRGIRQWYLPELKHTEFWIPSVAKHPLRDGRVAWRQSRQPDQGGVRICRYGSQGKRVKEVGAIIRPWRTYPVIQSICQKYNRDHSPAAAPALCLSGDEDCPALSNIMLVDVDFKPSMDAGTGLTYRDNLRRAFLERGFPCFASSSLNGFHAIGCLDADSIPLVQKRKESAVQPIPAEPSVKIDWFLPGAGSLVVVWLDRPLRYNGELYGSEFKRLADKWLLPTMGHAATWEIVENAIP